MFDAHVQKQNLKIKDLELSLKEKDKEIRF